MKKAFPFQGKPVLAIFVLGLAFHLWNIGVDLPDNFYTDEPHHINEAASFGSGNLNPHDFKYPTLWPYILAGMLSVLYAAGSLTGVVASAGDFAQKYVYHPGFFFYAGRVLSTVFLCLVPIVFYKIGTRYYTKTVGWVSAFMVFTSSSLSIFGLEAGPYSALVFFAACALYPLHEALADEGLNAYGKAGFCIGLSMSCHYVAAPFVSLLSLSIFREPGAKRKLGFFAAGIAAAMVGFFLGTPFLLLELKATVSKVLGFLVGVPFLQSTSQAHVSAVSIASNINPLKVNCLFRNTLHFMDLWGVGFFLALVGLLTELRAKRWRVLLWFAPYASALPILLVSYFGTMQRYVILLTVPLYIPVAQGTIALIDLCGKKTWLKRLVAAVIAALFISSYIWSRWLITIPDIRTQAKDWIVKNVPAGERIFLPGPYEGPQLMMAKPQLERLYQRTRDLNHPRAAYFKALLDGYPGGGYEIFYLKKTIEEVLDLPDRTARSFQAQEVIDVTHEGVAALAHENIHWVLILKDWENLKAHERWIKELRSRYTLVASFSKEQNKTKGYSTLEIYHE